MKPNPQVLLVDRNSSDVKVVRDTLGSAGLEIHVRASASAALVAFHALEPDLVIVDSDVPGTSGAAVSREIKNTERGKATPVILMAEGPLEENQRAQTLTASGCTMLLQKPLMPQDLLDTLSRFLPGAFIGKDAKAAPVPKSTAPRRAAGVMRDPGTPFTADSFDEESLGALLDQVFPTSDSGGLAQRIRTRSSPASETHEKEPPAPHSPKTPPAPVAPLPGSAAATAPSAPPTPSSPQAPAAPVGPPSPAASLSAATMPPIQETLSGNEPSASELVAEYLAQDSAPIDPETLPPGLSVKDAEALDRLFDGPMSAKAQPADLDVEPLETVAPIPAPESRPEPPSMVRNAAAQAPPAKEPAGGAKRSAPTPPTPGSAETSFDGLGDLDLGEPEAAGDVWQELEAALPPALPQKAQDPGAPAKIETARSETTKSEPTEAAKPMAAKPEHAKTEAVKSQMPSGGTSATSGAPATLTPVSSPPAAPISTTRVSKPPAPEAPMLSSVPVKSASPASGATAAKPPAAPSQTAASSSAASMPSSPATPAAAPEKTSAQGTLASDPPAPIETIPLARGSEPAQSASAASRAESRRSKKNKKAKGRRQDGSEPIPLAAEDPAMSREGAMQPQSVAESLTARPDAASARTPALAADEDVMLDASPRASAPPRRTGALVIVGAGLALAAAVAIYFVLSRSGDSDLRPTTPDRAPSPHASIKNEDAAPGNEESEPEALPPVIPESPPPADAAPGTPATDAASAPAADASQGTVPDAAASTPSATAASSERGGHNTKPSTTPPSEHPASASGPAPSRGSSLAPANRTVPPVAPPSSARPSSAASPSRTLPAEHAAAGHAPVPHAPDHSAPGRRAPIEEPPAPEPEPAPAGGGSGPPAARASVPADPGASEPPTEAPASPQGRVALGATMPAPAETMPKEEPGETVLPLASPVPLSRPAPLYPPAALEMKTTGRVGLLVKVEPDGRVSDVKVVSPAAPALNAAALSAARRWTYKPAHRGMDPVATWIEETVVFRLK